jgi:hypothetical protein
VAAAALLKSQQPLDATGLGVLAQLAWLWLTGGQPPPRAHGEPQPQLSSNLPWVVTWTRSADIIIMEEREPAEVGKAESTTSKVVELV